MIVFYYSAKVIIALKFININTNLIQGRVIYWGPSDNAIDFFSISPLGFDFSLYNNPVDFITDISSCTIHGRSLLAEDLKKNFELNEMGIRSYKNLTKYFGSIEKSSRIGDADAEAKLTSLSNSTPSQNFLSNISCKLLTLKFKSLFKYEFWESIVLKKHFLFIRYYS